VKRSLSVGSGLVGATSVAVLNHLAGRYMPGAPRLDIPGLQLVTAAFDRMGIHPPRGVTMKIVAPIESLVSNSIFYGLVSLGKPGTAWPRGGVLGLAMGVGAVTLPAALGVGERETDRTPRRKREPSRGPFGRVLAALTFASSQHSRSRLPKAPAEATTVARCPFLHFSRNATGVWT